MISLIMTSLAIGLFIYVILKWGSRNHDVFAKQGIKFEKPLPFIGTSSFMLRGKSIIDKIVETYQRYPNEKVVGLFDFTTPLYLLRNPELIKQLTIKDFPYFQDHKVIIDSDFDELFGNMLLAMKGKQWRDMRSSLSPLFTGSKMKTMLQLIIDTSQQLVDYLKEDYEINGLKDHDIKDILSKYTIDVIATCAFGVGFDSFRNPDNEIYKISEQAKELQKPTVLLKLMMMIFLPKLSKLLGVNIISEKARRTFEDLIINTMEVRKREGIVRPDMIQLLMKLREGQLSKAHGNHVEKIDQSNQILESSEKLVWTDAELIAQSFIFFIAGFDTTSRGMMFMAYELAVSTDIQKKLIEEIDETNESLGGKPLTYEILTKMKYLDMVVSETLRKWPPAVVLDRECVKTYKYEDEDGLKFTVEKGSMLWVPVFPIHRDPQYYPDPEKFDPERFSDENKGKIDMNAYLPFGSGPRNCLGMRFALMEIKVLFFYLLLNFKLKISKDTQIPLKLKSSIMGFLPEKDIRLYIEPRTVQGSEK